MRFTNEQKNLSDGMRILLGLYNDLMVTPQEEWFRESIIRKIAELLFYTVPGFTNCWYSAVSKALFHTDFEHIVRITAEDFECFLKLMKEFYREDLGAIDTSFTVVDIGYELRSGQKNDLSFVGHKTKRRDRKELNFFFDVSLNRDEIEKSCKEPLGFHYQETLYCKINVNSEFTRTLLFTYSRRSTRIEIPMPSLFNDVDFMGLLRYFFVKYHLAFDSSFDRIKVCQYDQCRKLYFEKRKTDSGQFCSNLCRKKSHRQEEPEKFDCRERQKAWINSKISNKQILEMYSEKYKSEPISYGIYKHECTNCTHQQIGGYCPILLKKNKKLIDIYGKYLAKKKNRRGQAKQ